MCVRIYIYIILHICIILYYRHVYTLVPTGLCSEKLEIMRFEQGKLWVKSVELCAKLCVNSNNK